LSRTIITRRAALGGLGVLGCSIAAHPLLTPIALAAAPGDSRLVVILLRGGMDGLDVLQPVGDPDYANLRPNLRSPSESLTDFFALNEALSDLRPLWDKGELAFAQAVATPYRDKRSHFDGQDVLEAGTALDVAPGHVRDGWLNRLLQTMQGISGETAYAVGLTDMKILRGTAPAASWSPRTTLPMSAQARLLLEQIYLQDPLFHEAATEAIDLANSIAIDQSTSADDKLNPNGPARARTRGVRELAEFAGSRLNGETRIAAFSITGWDTHRNQINPLKVALLRLSDAILTLKSRLGDNWQRTTVLAMTEFGRSVRENGNKGTDHGTGGTMVLAGGAVRGGQVYGDWPGLSEAALYNRRDLMPTADVRSYAAWTLNKLFGASRHDLETSIFPGLDLSADPGFIL